MRATTLLEARDARAVIDACKEHASGMGLAVSLAVVDGGGYPILIERMDGVGLQTPAVALQKARTAVFMRAPSKGLEDRVKTNPELLRLEDYLPMQGGVPIMADGDCIGAVGISGARPDQDEEIARRGLQAL